jgi:hypothetical protein
MDLKKDPSIEIKIIFKLLTFHVYKNSRGPALDYHY